MDNWLEQLFCKEDIPMFNKQTHEKVLTAALSLWNFTGYQVKGAELLLLIGVPEKGELSQGSSSSPRT